MVFLITIFLFFTLALISSGLLAIWMTERDISEIMSQYDLDKYTAADDLAGEKDNEEINDAEL